MDGRTQGRISTEDHEGRGGEECFAGFASFCLCFEQKAAKGAKRSRGEIRTLLFRGKAMPAVFLWPNSRGRDLVSFKRLPHHFAEHVGTNVVVDIKLNRREQDR